MSDLRLALGGWRVPACKKRPACSVQTLVAVLAQLELTSRQWEISTVNSPKWQNFVSSPLMLCRVSARHLKESLFVKPEGTPRADGAHGCFSGAAAGSRRRASWEQRERQLEAEGAATGSRGSGNWEQRGSSNWEQREQPVLAGRVLRGGMAAARRLAPRRDVSLPPRCFLRCPAGPGPLLAAGHERSRKITSLGADARRSPVCWPWPDR